MKCLDIKAGSICLYKEYNWFKRVWSRITRKKLPYNFYKIYFGDSSLFVELTKEKVKDSNKYIILEPIKPYSKKEKEAIKKQAIAYMQVNGNPEDLYSIINLVRANTIDPETFTISGLLQNKYYKVVYDSEGKNF